jgi:hypothetical protein
MTRRAEAGSATPDEMNTPGSAREAGWWRRAWRLAWRWLMPVPDATLVIDQLNGQLAVLEGARADLEAGWVQGGWWSVSASDGTQHLATGYLAAGGNPGQVDGVCLVGALVRAGSRLRAARSNEDVGRAVDAVYDALWASRGQPDTPRPGGLALAPVPSPDVRLARIRTLTRWNDQAGRRRAEVVGVVDRAISATIMDLMSAPRPAQAEPAGARQGASAR